MDAGAETKLPGKVLPLEEGEAGTSGHRYGLGKREPPKHIIYLYCQTTTQHPLHFSQWPVIFSPIMSEPGEKSCANTPHTGLDSLPKVPTQKLVGRSVRLMEEL